MKVPPGDISQKVVDLDAAFDALSALPQDARARAALTLASEFLEYAAYEMAVDHAPGEVAEIVMMAARLERSAQKDGSVGGARDAPAALG